MDGITNEFGQPVGAPLPHWTSRPWPPHAPMVGRYGTLEPLDVEKHGAQLFEAFQQDAEGRMWTYLAFGPFATRSDFEECLRLNCLGEDPQFYALVQGDTGKAVGMGSFLRITPEHGVIEVGWLAYSPALQRTRLGTEAMFLMMRRVFDELGYRRYEWKCDALNEPSRHAAVRLGFQFEGIFRQAVIYKGRNRDTAWFSILDSEWPRLKRGFEQWLEPANFDAGGVQRRSLQSFQKTDD